MESFLDSFLFFILKIIIKREEQTPAEGGGAVAGTPLE